jgi:hypothetical protein
LRSPHADEPNHLHRAALQGSVDCRAKPRTRVCPVCARGERPPGTCCGVAQGTDKMPRPSAPLAAAAGQRRAVDGDRARRPRRLRVRPRLNAGGPSGLSPSAVRRGAACAFRRARRGAGSRRPAPAARHGPRAGNALALVVAGLAESTYCPICSAPAPPPASSSQGVSSAILAQGTAASAWPVSASASGET